jgi:hypothetical protein
LNSLTSYELFFQGENGQQYRIKRSISRIRKATQYGYCGEVAGHIKQTCPQNPERKKNTPPSSNSRSKKKARNTPNIAADANPINSDSEHGSKDKDSDGDDEENERRRTGYLDPGLIEDRLAENLAQTGNDDPDDPYHDEKWAYEDVIEQPKIHTRERNEVDAPFEPSTSKTYAGSRNLSPEIISQGQFLDLLFTGDIIQHFVENTNSFVSQPVWLPKDNVDEEIFRCYSLHGHCPEAGIEKVLRKFSFWRPIYEETVPPQSFFRYSL